MRNGTPPRRLFLAITSLSIRTRLDWFAKKFPVYQVLPISWLKKVVVLFGDFFTPKSNEERKLFLSFVREADSSVIRWGIHQTLYWKQKEMPGNIIHIHGSKDRLFPVKKIKTGHIIKGGTHFMVYNRAAEISELITKELESGKR